MGHLAQHHGWPEAWSLVRCFAARQRPQLLTPIAISRLFASIFLLRMKADRHYPKASVPSKLPDIKTQPVVPSFKRICAHHSDFPKSVYLPLHFSSQPEPRSQEKFGSAHLMKRPCVHMSVVPSPAFWY